MAERLHKRKRLPRVRPRFTSQAEILQTSVGLKPIERTLCANCSSRSEGIRWPGKQGHRGGWLWFSDEAVFTIHPFLLPIQEAVPFAPEYSDGLSGCHFRRRRTRRSVDG